MFFQVLLLSLPLYIYAGHAKYNNIEKVFKKDATIHQVDISPGGKVILEKILHQKRFRNADVFLTYHCKSKKKLKCKIVRFDTGKK